jgi:hypothetical protein
MGNGLLFPINGNFLKLLHEDNPVSTTFDLTQFLAQNGALGSAILLLYFLFGKPQMQAIDKLTTAVYDLRDDIREVIGRVKVSRTASQDSQE